MTPLDQKRRERARNGSRRQRDLDALATEQPDWDAFIAEHFPDESYGYTLAATQGLYLAKPKRDRLMPSPDAVRERMREKGWLRVDLKREEATCR